MPLLLAGAGLGLGVGLGYWGGGDSPRRAPLGTGFRRYDGGGSVGAGEGGGRGGSQPPRTERRWVGG